MNITRLKSIIQERELTDDEWADGVEKCQRDLINVLCEDIDGTVEYLRTDCTADEFSWISEVFDEIVTQTGSREFVDALRFLAEKYPEETERYNIVSFIDSAECLLDEMKNSGPTA